MNVEIVSLLINAKRIEYRTIEAVLKMDDETVLYFLDEYPLKKIAHNPNIKNRILNKIKSLYIKYKKKHIGNVETLLNAVLKLFPKNFFYIIGTKSIKSYSDIFQITIFDYCLENYKLFYKKDILLFIKNNSQMRNIFAEVTKLIIEFVISKKDQIFKKIIEITKINKENTLFVERLKNIQKDLHVFSSKQFSQLL
ncbi:hypothetical protein JST56_07015 [Candidatus Dependentiae bacterium]|nr:hypothetical protein [Candidatus Dependentiae bacterium]